MRVRNDFTQEMWLSYVMETNTLAWNFTKNKVTLGLVGQIPRSIGRMLERDFLGELGKLDMLPYFIIKMLHRYLCHCRYEPCLPRPKVGENQASTTPVYLPILTFLAFFVTLGRVHLDLQTLICSFLFLFQMTCHLKLPLLLPRAQIKQLGAFILYLTTNLPSLNCLDRFSFSILQHQFKHGMI